MNTDDKIVKGILHRDESALELLLEHYGGLIKSVVKYHLKSFPQYVEDCMWDVVYSLWNNMKSYDNSKNSLKNWIGAVSKYKCIDYKRKYKNELYLSELSEEISVSEIETELDEEIESILSCLSADDRDLFYRYYILGEPVKIIAKNKGKSSAFFHNRLSRGRNRIRKNYRRS